MNGRAAGSLMRGAIFCRSRVVISAGSSTPMPSARSVVTSVSSLRLVRFGMHAIQRGPLRVPSSRAVATLASTMHSSISLCASLRSGRSMAVICSAALNTKLGSGASKSSAPRRCRAFTQHAVHIDQRQQPLDQRPELCARLGAPFEQCRVGQAVGEARMASA